MDSYEAEDDFKFARRHGVEQMRRMMLALNITCLLHNLVLTRYLTHMVSRPNHAPGHTTKVHYFALAVSILASILLLGVITAAFFPTVVHVYQKVQDSYFALQILI